MSKTLIKESQWWSAGAPGGFWVLIIGLLMLILGYKKCYFGLLKGIFDFSDEQCIVL